MKEFLYKLLTLSLLLFRPNGDLKYLIYARTYGMSWHRCFLQLWRRDGRMRSIKPSGSIGVLRECAEGVHPPFTREYTRERSFSAHIDNPQDGPLLNFFHDMSQKNDGNM